MAPAIQAQWLKTSGITVRHLLWLLLALTHAAFAIEATERLAELNRTRGSSARQQRHVCQVSGCRSGAGEPQGYIALMANISNLPQGLFARATLFPGSRIETGPLGPYGPGAAFVLCRDAAHATDRTRAVTVALRRGIIEL